MNNEEQVYRVSNVFYYIIRGRRLIAIFCVIGLIIGVILSGVSYLRGEMSKEYQVTSSIAIIAQTRSGNYASTKNNPDTEDVRLAQEITDSAIYILRSERTLKSAIERAGLDGVSINDIQRNLSLKQYNETQIIEITLYWRSNTEGEKILEAINDVSGEILLETLKIGNVSVVNSPTARFIFGGNVSASTWVVGAAGGALLAIAICILKLFLSPVLTHVKDTERLFSLKSLGAVAYDKNFSESAPFAADDSKAKKGFVSLACVLANRMEEAKRKKIIITSSIHSEGRTTLTVNAAQQLALTGAKTLMVDCDFNNPRLSSLFEGQIPYERTLNAVYFGDADETDAICHISGCLDLLPAILSDAPITLDEAMLDVINKISDNYDYVLFDCPPVCDDAGVIKLKRITDIALLAVKFDYTELVSIEEAKKMLTESGINIIGCAVTSVKTFKDIMRETQKISIFMRSTRKRAEKEAKQTQKKEKGKKKREKKSKGIIPENSAGKKIEISEKRKKNAPKKAEISAGKTAEKSADKKPENSAGKNPEKSGEKTAESGAEKRKKNAGKSKKKS